MAFIAEFELISIAPQAKQLSPGRAKEMAKHLASDSSGTQCQHFTLWAYGLTLFFLWASLENTAMGHGAIIARQLQCNHLVVPEDYVAIQAKWTGDLDNSKISAILGNIDELRDAYKQGNQVGQALTSRSLKATSALSGFVVAKISDKITAKVAGKYTTKIVAKKIFGFAPLVGPLVAGTINTAMFVAPLENAAQEFYRTKARYVCA